MTNKPKISILMPTYNCDKYLEEALESLTKQTFSDFELIIIDDSSTDNSKNIALSYTIKDNRIKVIDNKYDKGVYGALNSGLDICTGDFIARADGDDISKNDRLEKQIDFLNKHTNIDIIGSGFELFGNVKNKKIFHPSSSIELVWKFLTNTYFCHPSVMFRKSVLNTIQYYPSETSEDFAFFSKVIQKHRGSNLNEILVYYRQHGTNCSILKEEKIKESIKNTFLKNFEFYTGSLSNSEIFYDFHYKRNISFKNLPKITNISYKISQKILKEYSISKYNSQTLYLYFFIMINIVKSFLLQYPRKIYKKYLNKK